MVTINNNACRFDLLLQKRVKDLLEALVMILRQLRTEIQKSDAGALYIKNSDGRVTFTEYKDKKEHGVGRNPDRLHKLGRAKYLRLMIKNLTECCRELEILLGRLYTIEKKYNLNDLVNTLSSSGLDMNRIYYSPKQLKRMQHNHRKNNFYVENLIHISNGGIVLRSKSEKLIANRLEEWKITFLYEYPLTIGGRTIYPDFTIIKDNGEIIYWEHFGKMNDDEYFADACERHRFYRNNGFSDHTNLIITWEEDLLDMKVIDHIIMTRICC